MRRARLEGLSLLDRFKVRHLQSNRVETHLQVRHKIRGPVSVRGEIEAKVDDRFAANDDTRRQLPIVQLELTAASGCLALVPLRVTAAPRRRSRINDVLEAIDKSILSLDLQRNIIRRVTEPVAQVANLIYSEVIVNCAGELLDFDDTLQTNELLKEEVGC